MKYIAIFLILFSFSAQAKRLAAIKNNQVYFICSDGEQVGLPQDYDSIKEIPQGIDESFLAVNNEGNLYQREKNEEELLADQMKQINEYKAQIEKGVSAIAYFRLLNDQKNLNESQKAQILSDSSIQQIIQVLSIGNIDLAKSLINAYQADGTLVTNEDKQKIITFLDK
jgi:Xaa-Pro aminopeptidase